MLRTQELFIIEHRVVPTLLHSIQEIARVSDRILSHSACAQGERGVARSVNKFTKVLQLRLVQWMWANEVVTFDTPRTGS